MWYNIREFFHPIRVIWVINRSNNNERYGDKIMTGLEFFLHVLWQIVWPPKGIIYLEEQAVQWIVAITHEYLLHYGYILIILLGFWILFSSVFKFPKVRYGRSFSRMLNWLFNIVIRILFAWVFLIYGALASDNNGNRGEANVQIRRRIGFHSLRYTSLHFRFGRWLYRTAYRLLGYIPGIQRNDRARHIIARVIAMVIILWGVWHIPYDLTH